MHEQLSLHKRSSFTNTSFNTFLPSSATTTHRNNTATTTATHSRDAQANADASAFAATQHRNNTATTTATHNRDAHADADSLSAAAIEGSEVVAARARGESHTSASGSRQDGQIGGDVGVGSAAWSLTSDATEFASGEARFKVCRPVFLSKRMYRLDGPEDYLFSLCKITFTVSKYPGNVLFRFVRQKNRR